MALTVSDVMTSPVFTLPPTASLHDAHNATRERGIRHLPIVDPHTDGLVGIVNQKQLIAKVVSLLTQYGSKHLAEAEVKVSIMDIALTDFDTVGTHEPLADVACFFLQNKHGCMPVVEGDKVVGVLTSSDFVKLTIKLLAQQRDTDCCHF